MDIKKLLTESLPDLAEDLFPPVAIVRDFARLIAGTDDDEEASARIAADPALQAEMQTAVLQHVLSMTRAEIDRIRAENEVLKEVNETMRVEAQSPNWWASAWRPFWGGISALAFLAVCVLVCVLAWRAVTTGSADALDMVPRLTAEFAMLFTIPGAILGVASWHRGKEKRIQAGEGSGPSLVNRTIRALKGGNR